MRESIDAVALVVGYWTLLCVLGLLALLVGSLVHDAVWPPKPPVVPAVPPPPIHVWRMGPYLCPHQLRHPVLHVDAPDEASAWRALTEQSDRRGVA